MPPAMPAAALDALIARIIRVALAHDDSLGGQVELMASPAPELQPLPVEGGAPFLPAAFTVTLDDHVISRGWTI